MTTHVAYRPTAIAWFAYSVPCVALAGAAAALLVSPALALPFSAVVLGWTQLVGL